MKTIFYKTVDGEDEADYWLNNKPYKEWFSLYGVLYEPNGNIIKTTVNDKNHTKNIVISITEDRFTNEGIIRRIGLFMTR